MVKLGPVLALLVLGAVPTGAEESPPPPEIADCALTTDEGAWVQRALGGWVRLTREILHIPTEPLPWIVTFDDACVWHVAPPDGRPEGGRAVETPLEIAGSPVPVRSHPHDGTIELPDGREIPARAAAFASVWDEGRRTFFVLATRSLWHRDQPSIRDHPLDDFFLGVAAHEMLHTRQLVAMARRVEALEGRCDLPERIDDATLEELFAGEPEFAAALEAERQLLFEAAAGPDPARRRELARGVLDHLHRRRGTFFAGEKACYAELEDLFLSLEGAAVWAHYRLAGADPGVDFLPEHPGLTDRAAILDVLRGQDGEWVQDAGFALFLLLDEHVPGWPEAVLGPDLASPVGLLDGALGRPAGE